MDDRSTARTTRLKPPPRLSLCPLFHQAIELIGRRWTGAIIQVLLTGPAHFNELIEAVPDLTPRMLSERLKELEAAGIVVRTVVPSTPVRTLYSLTEKGQALEPVLAEIGRWADDWLRDRP